MYDKYIGTCYYRKDCVFIRNIRTLLSKRMVVAGLRGVGEGGKAGAGGGRKTRGTPRHLSLSMLRARRTDSHVPSVAHRRSSLPLPPPPAAVVVGDGGGGGGYPRLFMSVLVKTATVVVLDIHDDSLTARISVLVMMVAPHVHRQYGHVPPWRKSMGGISLSPRGTCQIF